MSEDTTAGFVADLHIHSYLSRATSKQCDLPHLALWAQRKGIRLLATGDFTHPEWFARIEDELVDQGNGLFRLRDDLAQEILAEVPPACRAPVDFVLQVEISSIYKRGSKVRFINLDKRTSHSFWFRDAGKPESERFFGGEGTEIEIDLEPGTHRLLCGPHYETKGMIGEVTVSP